jgi:hypothetical protein
VDKLSTVIVDMFGGYPRVGSSVDNLSTINVDNFRCYPSVRETVDKLSTGIVYKCEKEKRARETRGLLHNMAELSTFSGNLSTFYFLLLKKVMVKSTSFPYPHVIKWVEYAESYPPIEKSVENLSTLNVDKWHVMMSICG